MHTGAALQELEHDFGVARYGGEMDGGVSCVVGRLEELVAVAIEQIFDDLDLAVLNGVAEGREGRLHRGEARAAVDGARRVGEALVRNLGHLAAQGAREVADNVLLREVGQGDEVRELGEGGLGGQVKAEDDAQAAELGAGGVDGRDEAVDALADVYDDDAALDGGADDLWEPAVGAAGDVAHAKGLEDDAPEVGQVEHSVDHFGLDAGEDAQAGDVRGVKVLEDFKLGNGGWAEDQRPVDADAEAVDFGQGLAVGAGKGLEGGGRDLCGAVAAVQLVAEEEADFRNDKGARDDERAEQVVDGVGLERKDGRLRAREDDRLAQVGQHEGQGRGRVGERVGAVEDDEAVEEVVVFLDGGGHGGPVGGGDVARVEEGGEFHDGVADVAVVGGWGGSEGVELGELAVAAGLEFDLTMLATCYKL